MKIVLALRAKQGRRIVCRYYQDVMGLLAAEMAPISVVEQAQLMMPVRQCCLGGRAQPDRQIEVHQERWVVSSLEHGVKP